MKALGYYFTLGLLLLSSWNLVAADLTTSLNKGLIDEANHDLDAAISAYKEIVLQHDEDRKAAATALLRLSETSRKQGKLDEAQKWAAKLAKDFPDQPQATLRISNNTPAGSGTRATTPPDVQRRNAETAYRITETQRLLKDSPDLINAKKTNGWTLLHEAVRESDIAMATYLLDNGADIEGKAGINDQITPLQAAVDSGHKAMAEFLIKRGADVNGLSARGNIPLGFAIERGFKQLTELLLKSGADINKPFTQNGGNSSHMSPLSLAVNNNRIDFVKFLIDLGAEVNSKATGWPPIHFAEKLDILKLLLEKGADPNLPNASGTLPLLGWPVPAVGAVERAELLLQHGAEPNIIVEAGENIGFSPLHIAAREGAFDFVRLLLKSKANPNLPTKRDLNTPLHLATTPAIVDALLAAGADVHALTARGDSPLHSALAIDRVLNPEIIGRLIKAGADVNKANKEGEGPLDIAMTMNGRRVIPTVTARRPRFGMQDASHNEIIEMLIKAGAKSQRPSPVAIDPLTGLPTSQPSNVERAK